MKPLDAIDAAIFQVVDGAILWLWNEWGVSWRRIYQGAIVGHFLCLLLLTSDFGAHYDAFFWMAAAFAAPLSSTLFWLATYLPGETMCAANLARRSRAFARSVRVTFSLFGVLDMLSGEWRRSAALAVMLLALLILDSAVPTKPRNKKRREAHITNLAWSPT